MCRSAVAGARPFVCVDATSEDSSFLSPQRVAQLEKLLPVRVASVKEEMS